MGLIRVAANEEEMEWADRTQSWQKRNFMTERNKDQSFPGAKT